MQLSLKVSKAIALSAVAMTATILSATTASAKPLGYDGTYVGGGIAAGVLNGSGAGEDAKVGGNIQGRVAIPNVPVSVRGAVLFSDDNSAVMPIVTYDIPVSDRANVYVGGGYSFVDKAGALSPLGNQDAPVVTVGAEAGVAKQIVVYGDAKLGINAYQSNSSALSLQAGVGYRF